MKFSVQFFPDESGKSCTRKQHKTFDSEGEPVKAPVNDRDRIYRNTPEIMVREDYVIFPNPILYH